MCSLGSLREMPGVTFRTNSISEHPLTGPLNALMKQTVTLMESITLSPFSLISRHASTFPFHLSVLLFIPPLLSLVSLFFLLRPLSLLRPLLNLLFVGCLCGWQTEFGYRGATPTNNFGADRTNNG